jgi:outer membrane receptor for ferrienterochelin and colicin
VDDRTVTYVQDREQPAKQNEFGGSLGGPIVKDHLFFYGAYSPRNENATNSYAASDGALDVERNIWRQQAFGKLSYTQRRLTAHWSTLWTPTTADGTLSSYNGATPNAFVGSLSSLTPQLDRGYEINQVNTNGTVDLSLSNAAFLRFRGGYFHDRYSDTGIPLVTSYTYQTPTTPLNAVLPPALQGGTNVAGVNTPRAQITDFDLTKRSAFDVDYNHSFSLKGYHTLKAGYGFQHTVNDINSFYPGGYTEIFWDRSFTFNGVTTGRGIYGYYAVNDRAITNKAGSDIHSLYVQDQWTVGSRLTLNLGLRTEHEAVPTFRPDIAKNAFEFGFGEKLAPRLGAAYDLRGDGQSKVFGSWGRYYDWTKYQLPRGSFGAETWCIYYRGLDTLELSSLNTSNLPGQDLWVNPGAVAIAAYPRSRTRSIPKSGRCHRTV